MNGDKFKLTPDQISNRLQLTQLRLSIAKVQVDVLRDKVRRGGVVTVAEIAMLVAVFERTYM